MIASVAAANGKCSRAERSSAGGGRAGNRLWSTVFYLGFVHRIISFPDSSRSRLAQVIHCSYSARSVPRSLYARVYSEETHSRRNIQLKLKGTGEELGIPIAQVYPLGYVFLQSDRVARERGTIQLQPGLSESEQHSTD